MIIHVNDVTVQERIRESITPESLDELAGSFLSLGQLQPIVVVPNGDGKWLLDAGERRLLATKRLAERGQAIKGLEIGQIRADPFDAVSERVRLLREFAENVQRVDFTYVEKAKFIRRFHEAMVAEVGKDWLQVHTAAALSLTESSVSYYLRVEEAVKTDPTVAKAGTLKAAVKRMKIIEKQQARQLEVKDNSAESVAMAESILKLGDAMELIKAIPDSSIDFVNFDPPWGDDVGHKSNENWDGFVDDTETSDKIINTLLPELYRVLKDDRMMVYWYRQWAYEDMCKRLEGAGFSLKFARTPCIWYKPDKVSDQNRYPEKQLLDSYETFLIARKGEPIFHRQGLQNVFVYERVPKGSAIHPTEKPLSLCTDLLSLCTIPGESVLDPTAGSASILHQALIGGRKPIGFELTQSIHARATTRLAEYIRSVKMRVIEK